MLCGFSKPYSNEGIFLVTSTDYFLKPVWNQLLSDEGSMVLVIQSLASVAHFTGPRCSKLDAEVKRRSKKNDSNAVSENVRRRKNRFREKNRNRDRNLSKNHFLTFYFRPQKMADFFKEKGASTNDVTPIF